MKLDFHATSSVLVVGITGDGGYSSQKLTTPAYVNNGDTLSVDIKPNPYLPPTSPWRLMADNGTVLPWTPNTKTQATAAEIIDHYARQLAVRRPAE